MALIKCKECGHEMSDHATSCPNCGCPHEPKQTVEEFLAWRKKCLEEHKKNMLPAYNPGIFFWPFNV